MFTYFFADSFSKTISFKTYDMAVTTAKEKIEKEKDKVRPTRLIKNKQLCAMPGASQNVDIEELKKIFRKVIFPIIF